MSRRPAPSRTLTGMAVALVLAAATACGSAPAPAAPADAPAAAPSAAAYPVTIEHKYGSTEITAAPQRVVLVGLNEQDAMLALGVAPVAVSNFLDAPDGIFPWAEGALGGRPRPVLLDQTDGIPFEDVAAQAPDLIVGLYSGLTDTDYATLSRIAPTVAQPAGQEDYTISWQDTTLTLGRILGRSAEAQQLVAATEQRLTDARAAHPEFAGRTGVAATSYEGLYFYSADDPRGRLLAALGFVVPADLQPFVGADGFGGNVPGEQAALLDTDAMVWLGAESLEDTARANPVFGRLDVVTQGRTVYLPEDEPLGQAFTFVTPLSIPYLLDGVVPRLAAAVDGDPATS
jgi:iron complex transport system substrate-binding protein